VPEQRRTEARHRAVEKKMQVLEQKGYALVGPFGQAAGDLCAGLVIMLQDDGIDPGIDGFGAGNRFIEQFFRFYLAPANEIREPEPVMLVVIRKTAHDTPLWHFPYLTARRTGSQRFIGPAKGLGSWQGREGGQNENAHSCSVRRVSCRGLYERNGGGLRSLASAEGQGVDHPAQ